MHGARNLFWFCCFICLTIATSAFGDSQQKPIAVSPGTVTKGPTPAAPPGGTPKKAGPPTGNANPNLDAGGCADKKGTVSTSSACNSGKVCSWTESGVAHGQCLER